MNNISNLLNGICNLVNQNKAIIESYRYQIEYKEDNTPVTKADTYIENLIRAYLIEELGDVTFIGEESYRDTLLESNPYIAILDPIDGTENFCSGLKEWGISFCLWSENKCLGSLIYLPELNLKLMSGQNIIPKTSRIVGLSSAVNGQLLDEMKNPEQYRIMGCAVYNLYNVIHGSYKKFINPVGARVWDFLPGVMLAYEYGCKVLIDGETYKGEFLDPKRKYKILIER